MKSGLVCRVGAALLSLALSALALTWFGLGDPGGGAGKQIVWIVVDTLRADHLGLYGYERPTSPGLDAWSTSGRVFERAQATSSWTLPSFGSMYTGLLPSRHGAGVLRTAEEGPVLTALGATTHTVAETLQEHGFTTCAIVNNPLLAPELGVGRGFETYNYDAGDNAVIRRADEMVDLGVKWIEAHRHESFFLVLHLFDPHMNYDAPPPFRGRFTSEIRSELTLPFDKTDEVREGRMRLDEADRAFVTAAYDEEIAFVDAELARLRSELEERGVLERGLVVLTSDHGEELFDHGGFEHGHALWQEVLHVPLILWGKGVRAGRERIAVSLADLAPTILEFAGVEPSTEIDGRSLWRSARGEQGLGAGLLYAEGLLYGTEQKAVFDWPYELVLDTKSRVHRLFDLEADPHERGDLAGTERARVTKMASLLTPLEKREADRQAAQAAEGAALPEATLEKLRSLGYLQ